MTMDERNRRPDEEEKAPTAENPSTPSLARENHPIELGWKPQSSMPSASWGSSGGRWIALGCGAVVVVLLALVVASVVGVDQGVRLIGERARKRVIELLPGELSPAEKERIRRDIDRIFDAGTVEAEKTMIAAFVREVVPLLEDHRLTMEEINRLEEFLLTATSADIPPPTPVSR